jgi:hypothetical protein
MQHRAGERTSQSEAGNFIAARETRQEVPFCASVPYFDHLPGPSEPAPSRW